MSDEKMTDPPIHDENSLVSTAEESPEYQRRRSRSLPLMIMEEQNEGFKLKILVQNFGSEDTPKEISISKGITVTQLKEALKMDEQFKTTLRGFSLSHITLHRKKSDGTKVRLDPRKPLSSSLTNIDDLIVVETKSSPRSPFTSRNDSLGRRRNSEGEVPAVISSNRAREDSDFLTSIGNSNLISQTSRKRIVGRSNMDMSPPKGSSYMKTSPPESPRTIQKQRGSVLKVGQSLISQTVLVPSKKNSTSQLDKIQENLLYLGLEKYFIVFQHAQQQQEQQRQQQQQQALQQTLQQTLQRQQQQPLQQTLQRQTQPQQPQQQQPLQQTQQRQTQQQQQQPLQQTQPRQIQQQTQQQQTQQQPVEYYPLTKAMSTPLPKLPSKVLTEGLFGSTTSTSLPQIDHLVSPTLDITSESDFSVSGDMMGTPTRTTPTRTPTGTPTEIRKETPLDITLENSVSLTSSPSGLKLDEEGPALPIEVNMFAPDPDWGGVDPPRLVLTKAPLEKILELLFLDVDDPFCKIFSLESFTHVFILTYPTFIRPIELFERVKTLYLEAKTEGTKRKYVSFLKEWRLFEDGSDFHSPKMTKAWESFITSLPPMESKDFAKSDHDDMTNDNSDNPDQNPPDDADDGDNTLNDTSFLKSQSMMDEKVVSESESDNSPRGVNPGTKVNNRPRQSRSKFQNAKYNVEDSGEGGKTGSIQPDSVLRGDSESFRFASVKPTRNTQTSSFLKTYKRGKNSVSPREITPNSSQGDLSTPVVAATSTVTTTTTSPPPRPVIPAPEVPGSKVRQVGPVSAIPGTIPIGSGGTTLLLESISHPSLRLTPDCNVNNVSSTTEPPSPRKVPKKKKAIQYNNLSKILLSPHGPPQVAAQITLICEKYFRALSRKEFLKKSFCQPKRDTKAPNLKKMVDFGNHLTQAITAEILKHKKQTGQLNVFKNFLQIAHVLYTQKNFFMLEVVIGALEGNAIKRLKTLPELLSESDTAEWKKLRNIIFSENHRVYIALRDEIHPSEPFIPRISIGGGLVELAKLEEIASSFLSDPTLKEVKTWINWSKMTTTAKIVTNVKRITWDGEKPPTYKKSAHHLSPRLDIQNAILSAEAWPNEIANREIALLRNGDTEQKLRLSEQKLKLEKESEFISSADEGKIEDEEEEEEDYCDTHELWGAKYNEMTERDWKVILAATSATLATYLQGETIIDPEQDATYLNPGEPVYMYRLVEGAVRLDAGEDTSRPFMLRPPNSFGEFAMLLPNETVSAKFVANMTTKVYKIDITKLEEYCSEDPVISRKFHYYLAWKFSRRVKRILVNQMRNSRDVPMTDYAQQTKKLTPEQKKEKNIIKKFSLPEKEMLLKEFRCKFIDLAYTATPGYFRITEHYFCFEITKKESAFKKFTSKIEISKILKITSQNNQMTIKCGGGDHKVLTGTKSGALVTLRFSQNAAAVQRFSYAIWEKEITGADGLVGDGVELCCPVRLEKPQVNINLSAEERNIILKGSPSHAIKISPNQPVLPPVSIKLCDAKVEDDVRYIYQVFGGTFTALRTLDSRKCFTLSEFSLFGEIPFFNGSTANTNTYNVVANNDASTFKIIDGYYLNVLFQHYPHLAGKFYRYFATMLCQRLILLSYM